MQEATVVAVCFSDTHLSEVPPLCRWQERDEWYESMQRSLDEVSALIKHYDCFGIFAGDLFDKYKVAPSLINFALRHFPDNCYAIPGQHDLPYHRLEELEKSAYGTLVETKKIKHLDSSVLIACNSMQDPGYHRFARLTPFHWKQELRPLHVEPMPDELNVAVVHKYVWKDDASKYAGATKKDKAGTLVTKLNGFDAAIFGDNHTPWDRVGTPSLGIPTMFNCGGFMRRRSDELLRIPRVGLLMSDGTIRSHGLESAKSDKIGEKLRTATGKEDETWKGDSMNSFMESLQDLKGDHDGASQMVHRAIANLDGERAEQVRAILMKAYEDHYRG